MSRKLADPECFILDGPHQFTIPVAWEYFTKGRRRGRITVTVDAKKVTRLRCVCGEEKSR